MAKDSRLTKRQLKKLAKEQTGIVKKDPNNLVARLKLAGALKDLGKNKEAVVHYEEVAKAYASTGKLVQAISVYKGILEIKPGHEKTEVALSELSAKRAKDIKAKSMPRLQQQDDGRWVMPTESDVSEEEGTDPGANQGKISASSPSVLRLPAPMPTEPNLSRRRRGRRSKPNLGDDLPDTASTPSFENVDMGPSPLAPGVPAQPEGFQPSLPSLADHESVEPPPGPLPPDPMAVPPDPVAVPPDPVAVPPAPVAAPPIPSHVPPARVSLPPEPPVAVPPPPPVIGPPSDFVPDDGGVTAERDLSAVAAKLAGADGSKAVSDPATATQRDVDVDAARQGSADMTLTADEPSVEERHNSGFLSDEVEEPTSPGPSGYTDTIRKSAVRIDVDGLVPNAKKRSGLQPGAPMRRTLVGVPTPETPDVPSTPLTAVPPPDESATGEYASPLPAVTRSPKPPRPDNKSTVQMEKEPDMPPPAPLESGRDAPAEIAEPAQEPQPLDDSADETLGSIFDDDEEAFWSELEGSDDEPEAAPVESSTEAAPKDSKLPSRSQSKPKPTLRSSPIPAPETKTEPKAKTEPSLGPGPKPSSGTPRPGKAKVSRKSSKMTIPMGAAAFKKAVDEEENREKTQTDKKSAPSAATAEREVQLEEIALFRDLSETSREMLQSRLVRRSEKQGTDIVREGDPGNALFVVSSGQVRVTKQDRQGNTVNLATLGPGAFFGEFALLSDRKRHATVTVAEEGVFFEISRKVIADLTKSDPSFGNTLRQFYRRRLLGTLVRSAPFFDPLNKKEREALMGRLRFRRIPESSKIITEGEPGGGFFLILIGEVQVTKTQPDGSEKVLSTLTDGSYFGEMSLLKGGNAVATVTTVTPTEIVQLAAAEFYRILSKYPQIWEEVNREAKRRELANLQILSGRTPDPKSSDDSVVM